jgi:hypothetical protein
LQERSLKALSVSMGVVLWVTKQETIPQLFRGRGDMQGRQGVAVVETSALLGQVATLAGAAAPLFLLAQCDCWQQCAQPGRLGASGPVIRLRVRLCKTYKGSGYILRTMHVLSQAGKDCAVLSAYREKLILQSL